MSSPLGSGDWLFPLGCSAEGLTPYSRKRHASSALGAGTAVHQLPEAGVPEVW